MAQVPSADEQVPRADLGRLQADMDDLEKFHDPDLPGWTRRVFTGWDAAGREWVAGRMKEAGLVVHQDPAGNLIGSLAGTTPSLVVGSHTDTVQGGGRFDGIIGVLGAIEVVRCMRDAGLSLRHELKVIDFLGEEPNDFGLSCVGSRALGGSLMPEHLQLRDPSGRTLGLAMVEAGCDPDGVLGGAWSRGAIAAYVELHIEQGPVLELSQTPIGVVTGIAGIYRWLMRVTGRGDHAGTCPMDVRRDAMCAAADLVLGVERLAKGGPGVATVGRLAVEPGATNVVPGRVMAWGEMRSVDGGWLEETVMAVDALASSVATRRQVGIEVEWLSRQSPTTCSPVMISTIRGAAERLGLGVLEMPSGAGHDAAHMATLGPMGMIFVPSHDGRSHCAEEWTDRGLVGDGVRVLLGTLLALDTKLNS